MSTGNGKPTMDLFDRIEQEAAKDDAARIVAMSDAELDEELRQGGLDPAAVRAKGRALGEELARKAAHAKRMKLAKVAGAVAVVLALAVAAYVLTREPGERTVPSVPGVTVKEGPNVAAGQPSPETLRARAAEACDEKDWMRCIALLDDAKEEDPMGDGAPEVTALRERATRGLRGE
jgi:hypothetical protein